MTIRLESNSNPYVRESPTWQDTNDTNTALDYRQLDSDNTGGTHNTATPTLITTLTIAAGDVTSYIEVKIEADHELRSDNSGGDRYGAEDGYIRVDIGESGSEATKKTFNSGVPFGSEIAGV